MPYTEQTWGDHNLAYPLSAARMTHMEKGIGYAGALPNLKEFGSEVGTGKDDTAAIQAAVNSLPAGGTLGPSGGTIWAPPGTYHHAGEINIAEKSNIHIQGAGSLVPAGAIGGGGKGNIGASVFIYEGGAGTRAWDFRSSAGCDLRGVHCFAWGSGFNGPIWDLSGTEEKPGIFGHFIDSVAEATRVGGKGTEKIVHCVGALLDYSNGYQFDNCVFSGCEYGVLGLKASGAENHSSVAHRFHSCFFAGNQKLHVANPQEAWMFDSCIAESLFSDEGVIKKELGFIGYTGVGYKTFGLNLANTWAGSNIPAERKGAIVEFRGQGLNIQGGSYNTAEVGVLFPEAASPVGCSIQGVRFWKLNSAIQMATKAKPVESIIAGNRAVETIALLTAVEKETAKGCIIQEAAEGALKVT